MTPALFVDRDGTLIVDQGYPRDPDRVSLLPGVSSTLAAVRALGFKIVLVSSQSGVARGMITEADVWRVHERMVTLLASEGAGLDAAYYCMHGPDDRCACRKPRPGLLERAAREHALDLPASFLVGDKLSDVDAGRAVGCIAMLLTTRSPPHPDCDLVHDWNGVLAAVTKA